MLSQTIAEITGGQRPLILDGGLGSELETRGCDLSSPLWNAELINQQPEQLIKVHRAYLDAGADCITTASYQASVAGLRARGMDSDQIETTFARSIELARTARDQYLASYPGSRRPLIAASIGPYGAYLADGSEYRGNYGLDDDQLREYHALRLQWLDRGGADLIAVETIPDLQEARVLAQLLQQTSTPAWMSFCCQDSTRLHDGNSVDAAIDLVIDHPSVFAVGFNCCPAELIEPLIERLRQRIRDKTIVVYPNSGGKYDAATNTWHGGETPEHWSELALRWYRAGAGIIGGCCRIGPRFIRQLADETTWRY